MITTWVGIHSRDHWPLSVLVPFARFRTECPIVGRGSGSEWTLYSVL